LLLSAGVFGYWRVRENAENQRLAEATLTEATSKYEIGLTQISSGDKIGAAESLRDALSLTESLSNNTGLQTRTSDLTAKIKNSLDIAEGVIRADAANLADASQIVGDDAYGPYLIGTSLYLISKSDASIASISTNGGEVSRVLDKPSIDGRITAATAVPVRSVLVFMTDQGKIYEFDTKDVRLNQQTVAGEFEQPIAMASFSTNIYSLDNSGNIYKRLKNSSGYGTRTLYITDGSVASGAVSLAIDSNIYAMKSSGEVIKYLGGKKQDYNISSLPFTVSKASFVFTDEDTSGVYVLEGDAAKVVRFDNKGVFINQYVSDNFRSASGMYIDDANKLLYVSSGGKIYKTTI
jgi:hypothetical protein